MESSRDKGDDTRVGYDIDITFGAFIAVDVCKLWSREGIMCLCVTELENLSLCG